MKNNLFYKTITHLRQHEEVMLFGNVFAITDPERSATLDFLALEFEREKYHHTNPYPVFDAAAAIWAAEIVYYTAQLILYRNSPVEQFKNVLVTYPNKITSSSILSADLCLRFLPQMLHQLEVIDAEDDLVAILKTILAQWPYSAIGYNLETSQPVSDTFLQTCIHHAFVNRIIEKKSLSLANHPTWKPTVLAYLGNYADYFWNDFYLTHLTHEQHN